MAMSFLPPPHFDTLKINFSGKGKQIADLCGCGFDLKLREPKMPR
jgi:hypothetical protein